MDIEEVGHTRVFFRCSLPRCVVSKLLGEFGSDAEACRNLRLAFEAAAERLALPCDSERSVHSENAA